MTNHAIAPRDYDILASLTRRVRLLAIDQARRIWWPGHPTCRTARRHMLRLVAAGLVQRTIINAHPLLPISRPLCAWKPGGREPDPSCVSQRARGRWSRPAEPIEVYWASRRTANLFGSTAGQLPNLLHRDHDLLLAQVYFWYRRHHADDARRWLGEDALSKAGYRTKDPDAFLLADDGQPQRVIESAGRYAPAQVASFHEHCADHDLAYELW